MRGMLAFQTLVKALNDYKKNGGKWSELEKESGTNNLGKLARGENHPTVDTWLKLHFAKPDFFPEPQYYNHQGNKKEITKYEQRANGTDINQLQGNGSISQNGTGLRGDVIEFAKLIQYYWSPKEIQSKIKELKEE